jgi:hypothetical protein
MIQRVTVGNLGRHLPQLFVGPAGKRIARRLWWRGLLFEGVVIYGLDVIITRRRSRAGVLLEGLADSRDGQGDFARYFLIEANKLASALTDIASEHLCLGLPGCPLCGRPAGRAVAY